MPADDDVDIDSFDVGHAVATRTMHRGDTGRVSNTRDL